MVLPLVWITQCCRLCLLLPSWALGPQGSNPKKSMEEQTSSSGGGKMRSPAREPWPHHKAELTQAELLEQQLELYQALLEGRGAWEAQALVLKIQKLKEQMKRHQENLRGNA
ncbi:LOW QUALITY PROTEIN: mitochondrial coiled-coil domain protein 1 [Callospermophilus lateralis]